MPKGFASSRTRWASSALRSRALEGMQPTLRQTPPQYLDSTTATLLPSWAARMAATYPPGPAPRTTTSKCGMRTAYAWDRSGRRAGAEGRRKVTDLARGAGGADDPGVPRGAIPDVVDRRAALASPAPIHPLPARG